MTQNKIHVLANFLGLTVISVILFLAFMIQILNYDLPCPLCLLQRVAYVAVGICFLMNLKFGIKTTHYGLMGLAAILGFSLAVRQVFLHVAPGDPGYGPIFFNLHLYTWSAISFIFILSLIAVGLLLEGGFQSQPPKPHRLRQIVMLFFLILILVNGISTLMQCGLLVCPENPVDYYMLTQNRFALQF